ncbi:MAG: tetratricopeptide repeat protein [Bacteroidales bacterium]|nr:tetratricopeptide repeat protein [Bacteroidales bacterium]
MKKVTIKCILNKTIEKKRYIRIFIAAAAVALLLILVGVPLYRNINPATEGELFAEFYEPFEDKSAGQFLIEENSLYEAKNRYKNGDYENALRIFSTLPDAIVIKAEKLFYSGLIYMELGQYNNAITQFERLLEQSDASLLHGHVKWYLGLCYLKTSHSDKAKKMFSDIEKNKLYNYRNASKLLKKM